MKNWCDVGGKGHINDSERWRREGEKSLILHNSDKEKSPRHMLSSFFALSLTLCHSSSCVLDTIALHTIKGRKITIFHLSQIAQPFSFFHLFARIVMYVCVYATSKANERCSQKSTPHMKSVENTQRRKWKSRGKARGWMTWPQINHLRLKTKMLPEHSNGALATGQSGGITFTFTPN